MAKNYKEYQYFANRPDIVKIFDDLEEFHNWCRLELAPFDEAHLYNRDSWVWRNFEKSKRPKREFNGDRKTRYSDRKPYNKDRAQR